MFQSWVFKLLNVSGLKVLKGLKQPATLSLPVLVGSKSVRVSQSVATVSCKLEV
jgi:hypothetical protein